MFLQALGYITNNCVNICDSKGRDIFLGILYGYKMLLQVVALVLAFSTRKVKVKGLDDAKYIGAGVYVTSIVLAVVIVATYSLNHVISAFAALFCTGFLVGTTAILALVFVPLVRSLFSLLASYNNILSILVQMVGLYRDPKGENIFSEVNNTTELSTAVKVADNEVQRRIKELEDEVNKKNVRTALSMHG